MPPPVVGPRARAKQPLAEAVGRTESWLHPLRSAKARIGPPDALTASPARRPAENPSCARPLRAPSACQGGGEALPASAQGDFPGK